jgi:isopentenyl phosphate kinase
MMSNLVFLKLGGSLITDKTREETVRPDVLTRLAIEIKNAIEASSGLSLLVGHGSGSFGHVAAAKHGTRQGVHARSDWIGFAEVSSAAARLNGQVRQALVDAGVPAVTFQPSASAICEDGSIVALSIWQIEATLQEGLVPIVYGDVAIDTVRGGTIISTEEILTYLSEKLEPSSILLAGETEGVLDNNGALVSVIRSGNILDIRPVLGGSRGTDVTGGMASKVDGMVKLSKTQPSLQIRIFSGLIEGAVERCLTLEDPGIGTLISSC